MKWKLTPELTKKVEGIKLFVLDVDGVLTDGKIIINGDGTESKNFNVRDGMGIAIARERGYKFAVISGRYSEVVTHRTSELGMHEVYQSVSDKLAVFNEVIEKFGFKAEEAAFIGDDINDIPLFDVVGLSGVPADADNTVLPLADFTSKYKGGEGAVREFIEMVLTVQDNWGL